MRLEPQGVLWGRCQRTDGPKDKYILGVFFFSTEIYLNSKAAAGVRGELAAKNSQDPSSSTAHTGGRKCPESQASFNGPGVQHKPYRQYMKM